jgi:hypothetical protein
LGLTALALPSAAPAASVTPQFAAGNPSCADYGLGGLKVDGSDVAGDYSDGTLSVHIEQAGNGGKITSWTSSTGVDKVLVKGGAGGNGGVPGSNVYSYSPAATGDTDLDVPNGTALSHIEFCYGSGSTPPPSDTPPGGYPPGGNPPGDTPPSGNPSSDSSSQQPAGGDQQGSAPAGADQPNQLVLGARIAPGSARLVSASGCASRTFTAGVRGTQIARVVFRLDGKRIATVTKRNKAGLYALRINPAKYRVGVHRVVVTVTFNAASHTKKRTLRASFQRCGSRLIAPRFTG